MSRILLLGFAPLPFEEQQQNLGLGIRTWQFAQPLLEAGHEVYAVLARCPQSYSAETPAEEVLREGMLTRHYLSGEQFHDPDRLQRIHDQVAAQALVGATIDPSSVAARLQSPLPLWGDIFGSAMAEAQVKAFLHGDDLPLFENWAMVEAVLDRGDVFSAVSSRQVYALLGELGALGRLNRATLGYTFVHHLPCAVDPAPLARPARPVLRGRLVPEEAFLVLFSGGYNTWTDVDTLFAALELALEQVPQLVFVSTGGALRGHDEITYPRLEGKVGRSRFRERFLLRGWRPLAEVRGHWVEADLGVNVDRPCYEAILGSRNRILDWLKCGLPVLTSRLTELGELLEREGLGLCYRAGDPADLAEKLIQAAGDRAALRAQAERARGYAERHLTFAATTRPLLEWARTPAAAPDRGRRRFLLSGPGRSRPPRRAPLAGEGERAAEQHFADGVAFLEHETPAAIPAGETVVIRLMLRNTGRSAWERPEDTSYPVNVSYHWHDSRGAMVVADGLRTHLPGAVEPGAAVTVAAKLQAPLEPGAYTLQWDLVRELIHWFSQVGDGDLRLPVEVH